MVNTQISPIIVEHINDQVLEPEPRNSTPITSDELMQTPIEQQPTSQEIVTIGCWTIPPYPETLSLSK